MPPTLTAAALRKGFSVRVRVPTAGRVAVVVRAPAKTLGRRGGPVVVARGGTTAKAAGVLTVSVRPVRALRSKLGRLRGTKVSVTASVGATRVTARPTLR